jgi:hypothetical protein
MRSMVVVVRRSVHQEPDDALRASRRAIQRPQGVSAQRDDDGARSTRSSAHATTHRRSPAGTAPSSRSPRGEGWVPRPRRPGAGWPNPCPHRADRPQAQDTLRNATAGPSSVRGELSAKAPNRASNHQRRSHANTTPGQGAPNVAPQCSTRDIGRCALVKGAPGPDPASCLPTTGRAFHRSTPIGFGDAP